MITVCLKNMVRAKIKVKIHDQIQGFGACKSNIKIMFRDITMVMDDVLASLYVNMTQLT